MSDCYTARNDRQCAIPRPPCQFPVKIATPEAEIVEQHQDFLVSFKEIETTEQIKAGCDSILYH